MSTELEQLRATARLMADHGVMDARVTIQKILDAFPVPILSKETLGTISAAVEALAPTHQQLLQQFSSLPAAFTSSLYTPPRPKLARVEEPRLVAPAVIIRRNYRGGVPGRRWGTLSNHTLDQLRLKYFELGKPTAEDFAASYSVDKKTITRRLEALRVGNWREFVKLCRSDAVLSCPV